MIWRFSTVRIKATALYDNMHYIASILLHVQISFVIIGVKLVKKTYRKGA